MSITVKTRKILWSKSGNRCALCKCLLVEKINSNKSDFIVGEECHIISSKKKGPRGNDTQLPNYDTYDNLILMCANHHKLIDEYPDTYSSEVLILIKENHESWIKEAIQKEIEEYNRLTNNIEYLDEIVTWEQLDQITSNAHFYFNDFSSIKDEKLVLELSAFFDSLNDYSDINSDIAISQKTRYLIELNNSIKNFKQVGITIFGKDITREYKIINGERNKYTTSIFVAKEQSSSSIIDGKLLVKLPDDFTPTF